MINYEHIAKISSKGQITLPKYIREELGVDRVRIIIEDHQVRIDPVRELGGSLNEFARKEILPEREKELAWEAAVKEKHATD